MEERNSIQTIAVLMSTFNGEKYLTEQIETILKQKNVIVHLYIRDDGSSDNTISIIEKYQNDYDNVSFYNDKENIGVGMSFLSLLKKVYLLQKKYDYYAFADQDDIWLPEKLSKATEKIGNTPQPMLYCSNQIIYQDNKESGLRFSESPDLSLKGHITKNFLSGCTFVMNKSLVENITKDEYPDKSIIDWRLHDAWIFLVALCCGEVIYDHNSYIKYRIHQNNVVGLKKASFPSKFRKFFGLIHNKSSAYNLRSKTAKELLSRFSNTDDKNKVILKEVAEYNKNWKNKFKLLNDSEIYKLSGENPFLYKLKVFCNYI